MRFLEAASPPPPGSGPFPRQYVRLLQEASLPHGQDHTLSIEFSHATRNRINDSKYHSWAKMERAVGREQRPRLLAGREPAAAREPAQGRGRRGEDASSLSGFLFVFRAGRLGASVERELGAAERHVKPLQAVPIHILGAQGG